MRALPEREHPGDQTEAHAKLFNRYPTSAVVAVNLRHTTIAVIRFGTLYGHPGAFDSRATSQTGRVR